MTVFIAVVGLALTAGSARAGTYSVWSCKTPSGQPTTTTGWVGESSLMLDRPGNDCEVGGRLSAKLTASGGAVSGGLSNGWRFVAPPGITLTAADVRGSMIVRGASGDRGASASTMLTVGGTPAEPGEIVATCDTASEQPCATGTQRWSVPVRSNGGLLIAAGCKGESGRSVCVRGDAARARVAIDAVRLTLSDESVPVAQLQRPLPSAKPVRGMSSVRLTAQDMGSGVQDVEVRIGAAVVLPRQPIGGTGSRCRKIPGTTAYSSPTPCPHRLSEPVRFDSKRARDGSQLMTVTVWDAAGNAAVAFADPVLVDNARRVQADGTILMPAVGGSLSDQLGGGANADGPLRPIGSPTAPNAGRILLQMNLLADAQLPYCWGGGHQSTPAQPSSGTYCWQGFPARKISPPTTVGLDCSGAVSWVLQHAGYDIPTMDSSGLAGVGESGEGESMTIWSNADHVFLEVEIDGKSYYWGTSRENPEHGAGWHQPRSTAPFTPRHLPGM